MPPLFGRPMPPKFTQAKHNQQHGISFFPYFYHMLPFSTVFLLPLHHSQNSGRRLGGAASHQCHSHFSREGKVCVAAGWATRHGPDLPAITTGPCAVAFFSSKCLKMSHSVSSAPGQGSMA